MLETSQVSHQFHYFLLQKGQLSDLDQSHKKLQQPFINLSHITSTKIF